jgi:hypothetical protein
MAKKKKEAWAQNTQTHTHRYILFSSTGFTSFTSPPPRGSWRARSEGHPAGPPSAPSAPPPP